MIKLTNICKAYDKKTVLRQISFQVEDGEFIVITGKSGQGKTTLLNIMGLLEIPDSGIVSIDGKSSYSHKDKITFYRKYAGFLFQNFALIENETVYKNLKIGISYSTMKGKQKIEKIRFVLEELGLTNLENKKIYQLSGGEQQRVALARVILKEPRFIYADEPTGNLDTENRNLVFEYLTKLHNQGTTIIMVTHDTELVHSNYINRVIQL